jgi:hypothetical protein
VVAEDVRVTVTDWITAIVAVFALLLSIYNTIYNTVGKKWRGVRFTPPSDWRAAYFEWEGSGRQVTPGRAVLEQAIPAGSPP